MIFAAVMPVVASGGAQAAWASRGWSVNLLASWWRVPPPKEGGR